ncbi:MAG: hypothetical protein RIR01_7 [Bacteroidota bacterium]|jgi:hypothetical protein
MPSSEGLKNLIPFVKGKSGNPNGRPRKFVCLLKDMGYNKQDIDATIQNMMAMTISELAEVFKDDNATVLEKTVANAIKKGIEKGTLYSIETLISRVYGMPNQQTDNNVTLTNFSAEFNQAIQSPPQSSDNTQLDK